MLALKHQFVIAALAIALFYTNLGKPKLWDRDEPRNARCAVEMMERHDWTVPTFNGELRTHKPVLLYWLMMSAYALFGVNEFAARFWSAGLAVGTVLLTYSIGRRLLCARTGFWGAFILATTLMFNVAARAATPDSALMFFMTLALAIYVRTSFRPQESAAEHTAPIQSNHRTFYPRRLFAIPLYAAMGMAVLAKGPIGIVLPTAIIGLFLAIVRLSDHVTEIRTASNRFTRITWILLRPFSPFHLLRTAWSMKPFTALASAMAVALPWYLLVGIETDGKWLQSFLLEHNIG
ncbi:ArnT family glycosyltransferase, partial [Planctomycetota bacterium]